MKTILNVSAITSKTTGMSFSELLKFAYNSALNDELGMSSFEMDSGWKLKSPLDMIVGEQADVQGVEDFRESLKASLRDAQLAYRVSRARKLLLFLTEHILIHTALETKSG